jgi:hypothetical protein
MTMPALLMIVAAAFSALVAPQATVPMKPVDTGLGFTLSVPEAWAKGQPSRNNKFVMGSLEDDFAVVVADFGPAQPDPAAAATIYRESFVRHGLTPTTESEVVVAGKATTRYVLRLETTDGEGHAEAVLVQVRDEVYAVMVVTPTVLVEQRRAVIAKILDSIAMV